MSESSTLSGRVSSPPCASNPQAWEMDHGGLVDWLRSLGVCLSECPLLAQLGCTQPAVPGWSPSRRHLGRYCLYRNWSAPAHPGRAGRVRPAA
jgi:hypothetical protein